MNINPKQMKFSIRKISMLVAIATLPVSLRAQEIPIYRDASKPIEERIDDALSRMTLEEKVGLLHADRSYGSAGVPRLGIPENNLSDGPSGLRPEMVWQTWIHAGMSSDSCTAFPALVCLAATWNPEMGHLFGKSLGEEALYRDKNMLLGPAVNIFRTPMNGRNFEYMGEDPYLTSKMAVSYIKGVQENHVSACVKHFAVNNQETKRTTINTIVDERTLHEIYFPAFKAAVQVAGVWAVMGAYNKFNGQYCCHNSYLLNDVLRGEWGFDGVVVSDFGGTHDTQEAIDNGLDMEFGTDLGSLEAFQNYRLGKPYLKLLKQNETSEKVLNEKVRRVLRMMYRTNMSEGRPWGTLASEEHAMAARKIAEEGIVLLKNNNKILPVNIGSLNRILVVGENAVKMMSRDGGSSEAKSKYEVVPLEGIRKYVADRIEVDYQPGYSSTASKSVNDSLHTEAVKAAKGADIVLYIGGMNKNLHMDCEGVDRESYNLPYEQDALIADLSVVNPSLVAVMVCGNAYAMPWHKKVPAIVQAWYGGTEAGNAIADVLFGEVNPSGKLPFSFPVKIEDNAAHAFNAYPGDGETVEYKEGIFVGYRWFEKEKIKPLFAFGHGLSYTSFDYGKITLDKKTIKSTDNITVTIPITNSGNREGAEVVQLYIMDMESSLPRPLKELKGFKKVNLAPGETVKVNFTIGKEALSFYTPERHEWVVEPGKFQILVGTASDDIRSSATFRVER